MRPFIEKGKMLVSATVNVIAIGYLCVSCSDSKDFFLKFVLISLKQKKCKKQCEDYFVTFEIIAPLKQQ